MQVNVVKVVEDSDLNDFRELCDNNVGWDLVYSKKFVRVWTKDTPNTNFKIIKVRADFADVSANVVYDVLHDSQYRSLWDKYMVDAKDIGILNVNNDLCYYAVKSLPPFRGRDFVLQRSWLETPSDMIILNHSVCHEDYPPKKTFIRAISHKTGYLIRSLSVGSCQVTYVTQCDPRGSLPSWAINRVTQMIAPHVMKKLQKASLAYASWKEKNSPNVKPWLYPEQQTLPRVDLNKCKPQQYSDEECVDESNLNEKDLKYSAVDDELGQQQNGDFKSEKLSPRPSPCKR